jgi:hypothetical protein
MAANGVEERGRLNSLPYDSTDVGRLAHVRLLADSFGHP